jgi:3D-(3,5/4)-trihydroxycyclohexane-1,2-dione acylhydrolase (decyclizing)
MPFDHPLNLGAVGVTGTGPANRAAEQADLIIAVGTRLGDFTTGSRALFGNPDRRIIGLNVQPFDAGKHFALPLVGDADVTLTLVSSHLDNRRAPAAWTEAAMASVAPWRAQVAAVTAAGNAELPSDAQVIGAVQRAATAETVIVGAAGGLPGELHKLWDAGSPGGYHLEYGYSCMGYEIAGALGVKMAAPERDVVVMLGDGSWLMMNSEIATSVMLGLKLTIVLLDNGGFGCIDRLQRASGGESFNNLLATARHEVMPVFDFAAQAVGLGAIGVQVAGIAELEHALGVARTLSRTVVIVLRTDPRESTAAGGHWWDVGIPEVSARAEVRAARDGYEAARQNQRLGD